MAPLDKATSQGGGQQKPAAPSISLPKGGGAIRGIGEKFAADPVTGTGSMTVPIATSPGRSGFGPQLSLSYDSGSGNGPFGFGWALSIPAITRKTDKGLPQYRDADESDVYILSGAEDLVPVLIDKGDGKWEREQIPPRTMKGKPYLIQRYRPRIEGLFARIERWTNVETGEIHWRSITRDNVTTVYGKDNNSRIFDPAELDKVEPANLEKAQPTRIFSWLICQSYDDKGNAIVYEYAPENDDGIKREEANERNRVRTANRYLKRIKYGNRKPNRDQNWKATDPALLTQPTDWMFEIVFDHGEGDYQEQEPDTDKRVFTNATLNPPTNVHWPVRLDPFSTYRAGFEVRTYRLCRRVLMFHHFPQELGIADCLVRSTEFSYVETPIASFITGVTQSGYVRQPAQNQSNRYLKASLPPLEFEYSQIPSPEQLARQSILEVDAESLENLPVGLDGSSYQWMDLDGEGTSGILTEQADGWYYKRNLSANHQVREDGRERTVARFGPAELVASKPAVGLAGGAQFLDLAGDGQVDLVQMQGSVRGFYERTDDASWAPFQPFVSWPDLNTRDPDLKFVDLTGDGHADILITEGETLTWYPSLAEDGFGPAVRVCLPSDEEKGPRLVFADGLQSVYLADLSGDGLSDLVRIRNGEVCYWPNLGYGHFGAKVTMDNAPWFDAPDQFDQRRIRLADTDGSGTTDILYLGRDGVQIYFNKSGNRWSEAVALPQFPPNDNISSVQALDLNGNGTACLLWSSPLPGAARRPMRYIALMEEKPHLLVGVKNNLGAETKVHYAPSTKFYLDDKRDSNPWITRLPFPVHVVERVETYDHISCNHFVTYYAYHHGYFDGVEREFRGFGMVEQRDTEEFAALTEGGTLPEATNLDAAFHVPPAVTKTWFHTGAYIGRDHVSDFFAGLLDVNDKGEYYREPGLTEAQARALLLDDTALPDGLTVEEEREACRALKGSMLRQEVYALDGKGSTPEYPYGHPYTVTEQNFTIERLQPKADNRHAVFFTHAREAIIYHYERNPADPRIGHAVTLEVDVFGNVLRSVALGYPRANVPEREPEQNETHLTLTLNRFANRDDQTDWYRVGLPVETRTYEVVKPPDGTKRFTWEGLSDILKALVPLDLHEPPLANTVPYEQWDWRNRWDPQTEPGGLVNGHLVNTRLRLIEHVRTLYRPNDMGAAENDPLALLPLGTVDSLALPGESYKLAFTPGLLEKVYQRPLDVLQPRGSPPPENLLPSPANVLGGQRADRGGYVDLDGNGHWWIPSGGVFYSPTPNDLPASELTFARAHFFLPHRYRDPFGNEVIVTYDSDVTTPSKNHNLLLVETKDPLGNVVTVKTQDDNGNIAIRNDYRVLQPYWVTDPNRNRTRVEFDALGMLVAMAVMGKQGQSEGDTLDDPTTRLEYDLFNWMQNGQPIFVHSFAREQHGAANPRWQESYSYSDGFGREIQKKIQAEPGVVEVEDAAGNITIVDTTPNLRWVGSGWTIFNNKGKPVRQYEPFFSTHHQFQFGKKVGVSPILFYDPVDRVVATLHPNHTYEKVVFDHWRQVTYDANDTIAPQGNETGDPRTDLDIRGYVAGYFKTQPTWQTWYTQRQGGARGALEQSAATKSAVHANTPTVAYFDTLGRSFLTVAHNKFDRNGANIEERYPTRAELDIEGNQRSVTDALKRKVMRYDYDMLSNRIHQASKEAGERWMLNDVTGKSIRKWDSRGHTFRTEYDELRRPVRSFVLGANPQDPGGVILYEKTEYGEGQPNDIQLNLRTKIFRHFEGAGIVNNMGHNPVTDQDEAYDFKGNLLRSTRQLLQDYKKQVNWAQNPELETGQFSTSTTFDALNRPVTVTTPDGSLIRHIFNEANLLEQVNVNLRGAEAATSFVSNIDYNAKGQRTKIEYANGATTSYEYDDETFRLKRLETTRSAGQNGLASQLFASSATIQDLRYTYDPVGNITDIADGAIRVIFHNHEQVKPVSRYTYDAIYRLISAEGREHIGQSAFDFNPPDGNYRDYPFVGVRANPNDLQAVRNYRESYQYDEVGNIKSVNHGGNWTRSYDYDEPSLLEQGRTNNRLTRTQVVGTTETYGYKDPQGNDVHGCMTAINTRRMDWNFEDQLQTVDLGGGGKAYYVYHATGQRARKVHEHNGSTVEERIYLGGYEIYRKRNGSGLTLERETLHIMGDKKCIALVETKTVDQGAEVQSPRPLIRYQLDNHLGSACLELDDNGAVISYEEYYPYGSTSYQAVRSGVEVSLKRYRYTGKERDEETGLYYYGARYYSPWLGRWTSCDPISIDGGHNLYEFVRGNPIILTDLQGTEPTLPKSHFDALLKFIWDTARFIAGRENPPKVGGTGAQNLAAAKKAASPFGTASHTQARVLTMQLRGEPPTPHNPPSTHTLPKIPGIERIFPEPTVDPSGRFVQYGTPPGTAGEVDTRRPDAIVGKEGVGNPVGKQATVVTERVPDYKSGGGTISSKKYGAISPNLQTVGTEVVDKNPKLAKLHSRLGSMPGVGSNAFMIFYMLLSNPEARQKLIRLLLNLKPTQGEIEREKNKWTREISEMQLERVIGWLAEKEGKSFEQKKQEVMAPSPNASREAKISSDPGTSIKYPRSWWRSGY